jgi:hypothetical protein
MIRMILRQFSKFDGKIQQSFGFHLIETKSNLAYRVVHYQIYKVNFVKNAFFHILLDNPASILL